jgi:hypothetical protein
VPKRPLKKTSKGKMIYTEPSIEKNCILVSYNRRQDMKEKRFEVRYRSEKGEGGKNT